MSAKLTDEQAEKVLEALNKALDGGPWHASAFLGIVGKKLEALRDDFASKMESSAKANKNNNRLQHMARRLSQQADLQEVFIALYSSNGTNMATWVQVLNNLPRNVVSRPVYLKEEDLKARMRAGANPMNEAYVAMYISKSDIIELEPKKQRFDKFSKPLLALKDKSASVNNIIRFEHKSGTYHFIGGRLVKQVT